ncbi:MAG: LuxR family transcriptional regulator [Nakamurella sp.]
MIVGRAVELARLKAVLSEAGSGRPAVLVVSGIRGCGKTALLTAAVADLPQQVLRATGVESEARIDYGGLLALLRPLVGGLDAVTPPARRALRIALGMQDGLPPTEFALGAAVLELLAAASGHTPLVLVLDDIQWLDRRSLAAVLFALRRMRGEPVAAFVAVRCGSTVTSLLSDLPHLELRGLEVDPATELARAHRPDLPLELAAEWARVTHGNPAALVSTDPETVARLQLAAGQAALGAGKDGSELLEWASVGTTDHALRREIDLVLMRFACWIGDTASVYRIADRSDAAELHALAATAAWTTWNRDRTVRHSNRAVDLATGVDLVMPALAAANARMIVGAAAPDLELDVAEFTADPDIDVACPFAITLAGLSRFADAAALVAAALPPARRCASLPAIAWLLVADGMLLLKRGNLIGSLAALEEAVRLGSTMVGVLLPAQAHALLATVNSLLGRYGACRHHASEAHRLARPLESRMTEAVADLALARLDVAAGDTDQSVRRYRDLVGSMDRHQIPTLLWVPALPELIETLALAGQRQRARRYLAELADQAAEVGLPHLIAGLAESTAVLADDDELTPAFTAAAVIRESSPDPVASARAKLAHGRRLRRARRQRDAREPLAGALVQFEQMGMTTWAANTRRELAASGGTAPSRSRPEPIMLGLTPQEHMAAELAATGTGTRQIAATMFVSEKTVEAHLTRVYRKLGVRGRTELAHRFAVQGSVNAVEAAELPG